MSLHTAAGELQQGHLHKTEVAHCLCLLFSVFAVTQFSPHSAFTLFTHVNTAQRGADRRVRAAADTWMCVEERDEWGTPGRVNTVGEEAWPVTQSCRFKRQQDSTGAD